MRLLLIGFVYANVAQNQGKTVEPEVQSPRKGKTGQETASESFEHTSEEDITYSNTQLTSDNLLKTLFPGKKNPNNEQIPNTCVNLKVLAFGLRTLIST